MASPPNSRDPSLAEEECPLEDLDHFPFEMFFVGLLRGGVEGCMALI